LTPVDLARRLGWELPTAEQAAVIAAPLEPLLVVAGAGSGKTATMAARVIWLVATGQVRPDQILGLTFTRKAAAELAVRLRRRLAQLRAADPVAVGEEEPTVSTYHSYAARLLGDHALRDAREPTARLASPAACWQLAGRVVAEYDGPMDAVPWGPPAVIAAVLSLAGDISEHLCSVEEVRAHADGLAAAAQTVPGPVPAAVRALLDTAETRVALLPLVAAYNRRKAEREVLDHGDQVAFAARIAERHPAVGRAERDRYPVVLLDEYQDTGHAQRGLLRALFGAGHPVTAVGDPCQSIYGWRGASAGGLRRFRTDFPARDGSPAQLRQLATSFRNGERILAVANRLSAPLRAEGLEVPELVPAPGGRGRGDVVAAWHRSAADEAGWLAGQIGDLLASAERRPADIAVLVRRRTQMPRLREALEAVGVPVEVVGLGGLLQVPEVADIVATLKVVADPGEGAGLVRLLTGPRWRLGPRDLTALARRARRLRAPADPAGDALLDAVAGTDDAGRGSLVDAVDDPGPAEAYSPTGYRRIEAVRAELRTLRGQLDLPLPELVAEIARALGLAVELAGRPGVDPAAALADLDAFVDAAAGFAGDSDLPTVRSFLGYLAAADEHEFGLEPARVGSSDSVKLLTVHAAKGLEWPVVVLPGLGAGIFPARPLVTSSWAANARVLPFALRGDGADLPQLAAPDAAELSRLAGAVAAREALEERRLGYVAVTRAAEQLICTGFVWGDGKTPRVPSPFLVEVVEAGASVAVWVDPPEPGEANPLHADPRPVPWPVPVSGPDLEVVRAGAERVRRQLAAGGPRPGVPAPGGVPASWRAEADLLLAERAAAGRGPANLDVLLPGHLSVSALVELGRDPARLARSIRRPLPRQPAPAARRGTAFHTWLEAVFGQAELLDLDDLPGAADADAAGDARLGELQDAFRRSHWWGRSPHAVEVAFEMRVAGVQVRGRIDAVYAEADGRWSVVDWKTGAPPPTAAEASAAAVQLAAYRLAWSGLAGVAPEAVRAAFHYVSTGLTCWLDDMPGAADLGAAVEALPVAAG